MYNPKLTDWLEIFENQKRQSILIIPGGGIFADQVRQTQKNWQYDDKTAHKMALLTTDLYGLMLHGLAPNIPLITTLKNKINTIGTMIYLPAQQCEQIQQIPTDWRSSSDSIAAYIAVNLEAQQLCFIKSKSLPKKKYDIDTLSKQHYLDKYFSTLIKPFIGCISSFHVNAIDKFCDYLNGKIDTPQTQLYHR